MDPSAATRLLHACGQAPRRLASGVARGSQRPARSGLTSVAAYRSLHHPGDAGGRKAGYGERVDTYSGLAIDFYPMAAS